MMYQNFAVFSGFNTYLGAGLIGGMWSTKRKRNPSYFLAHVHLSLVEKKTKKRKRECGRKNFF